MFPTYHKHTKIDIRIANFAHCRFDILYWHSILKDYSNKLWYEINFPLYKIKELAILIKRIFFSFGCHFCEFLQHPLTADMLFFPIVYISGFVYFRFLMTCTRNWQWQYCNFFKASLPKKKCTDVWRLWWNFVTSPEEKYHNWSRW